MSSSVPDAIQMKPTAHEAVAGTPIAMRKLGNAVKNASMIPGTAVSQLRNT